MNGNRNCKYFKLPKSRTEWWEEKIKATVFKDQKNYEILKTEGWKVIVVWECELKTNKNDMINNKFRSSSLFYWDYTQVLPVSSAEISSTVTGSLNIKSLHISTFPTNKKNILKI